MIYDHILLLAFKHLVARKRKSTQIFVDRWCFKLVICLIKNLYTDDLVVFWLSGKDGLGNVSETKYILPEPLMRIKILQSLNCLFGKIICKVCKIFGSSIKFLDLPRGEYPDAKDKSGIDSVYFTEKWLKAFEMKAPKWLKTFKKIYFDDKNSYLPLKKMM